MFAINTPVTLGALFIASISKYMRLHAISNSNVPRYGSNHHLTCHICLYELHYFIKQFMVDNSTDNHMGMS
jgi:hypothetical protein